MHAFAFFLFFYNYNCKCFRYDMKLRNNNLVDTIITIEQNQQFRILKKEINSSINSPFPSLKIRLCFENLSDSTILLCNSGIVEGVLDSTLYLSYVMDWEYQCEFLLLMPKTKVNLVETLMLKGASKYLISFDMISNFSKHNYEKYFDFKNHYKSKKNPYISVGIKDYPPEIQKLEISRYGVRTYTMHY